MTAFMMIILLVSLYLSHGYKIPPSCEGKGRDVGDISNSFVRENAGLGDSVINWYLTNYFMKEHVTVVTPPKAMFSAMRFRIETDYPGQIELFSNFSTRRAGDVEKYVDLILKSTRVALIRDSFRHLQIQKQILVYQLDIVAIM